MQTQKFFHFFLIVGTALLMMATLSFFKQKEMPLFSAIHHSSLIAQNTNNYLGPNQRLPNNVQMIKIQVLVYNDPNPAGVKIVNAELDGSSIPLKPADIHGFRGQASFQKSPGKYKLKWVVDRGESTWPRTVEHEENVHLNPRDMWLQISISGDTAEIT